MGSFSIQHSRLPMVHVELLFSPPSLPVADGYGLMGCRLLGLKSQLWAHCHRIGHGMTSALLWRRNTDKNSSDLSRPDAQVHESIMSLHECVRSHHESLHNNHWVDWWLGWLCVLSLGHNAQEKIKCNKHVKVVVLASFSSPWLTVQL